MNNPIRFAGIELSRVPRRDAVPAARTRIAMVLPLKY